MGTRAPYVPRLPHPCYNGRMPKTHADFTTPLNILVTPEMKQLLIATSYHRGSRGAFGGVTRDMIQAGLDKYRAGLSPSERKAFDEILDNIKIQAAYLPGRPQE